MIKRWFRRRRPAEAARETRTPSNQRIYAVGDIHGRADLLLRLHALIADDAADAGGAEMTVVYLGDYVDRGLESRDVIDILIDDVPSGIRPVHLRGNHEDLMLRFLADPTVGPPWIQLGGDATLVSYGVGLDGPVGDEAVLKAAQDGIRAALPPRHLEFLRGLRTHHVAGDYLFVHAGVRPGVSLEHQKPADLMWIRDEFLASDADHGCVVVHGHSINLEAEFRPNRIGIDTGAYASGVLTCLVLEGGERRLLQT